MCLKLAREVGYDKDWLSCPIYARFCIDVAGSDALGNGQKSVLILGFVGSVALANSY